MRKTAAVLRIRVLLVIIKELLAKKRKPRDTYMLDEKIEQKITDLMEKMTLEEKAGLCHGAGFFRNAGVPRLGIPPVVMSDGPCGVRCDYPDDSWDKVRESYNNVSYLPANTALAATWNPERAYAGGQVIGCEARGRGKDMILAPGINIMRSPLCGRNYEYMGEDPCLTANLAAPFVQGVQSQGVSACVKHFAANNQETLRMEIDTELDERTLREIYLPGFKAAVREGGAYAVMGAYNKIRGEHCCHNAYLLQTVLKGEWGFDGVVVSDWHAVHDTCAPANNGLDIEMSVTPDFDDYFFADKLVEAVKAGTVAQSAVDDKVRRILRLQFRIGAFSPEERPAGSFNLPRHREEALKTAQESVVLLKNDAGILPLDPKKLKNLLVVGLNADRFNAPALAPGDSGDMNALYEITPLTGLMMRLGGNARVDYEQGYAKGGKNRGELAERAVEKARKADAVVFVGGIDRSFDCEGRDRTRIDLPFGQNGLINQLIEANPNTVVVILSGSPVGMGGFIGAAHAVVQSWYAGMESGLALAQVLLGDICPSGRLPFTIPKKTSDSPDKKLGEKPDEKTVRYAEGVFVGYRYYDSYAVEPMFCFGHGLSYTAFTYGAAEKEIAYSENDLKLTLSAEITNSGDADGAEVVQLYVAPKSGAIKRPAQELRAYKKVFLKRGETARVAFCLDKTAFSYYDEAEKRWVCEKGDYELRLSASSRDIRRACAVTVEKTFSD
jgi:Beta-glucosidase-related glycosidases